MSLAFSPLSEEEVLNLLKPGVYDFQVLAAENAISKTSGNAMIKLTLGIWDEKGNTHNVFDYLLPSLMYKIKHFCDATGLEEKYQQGQFDATDCVDRSGKCKIRIEESDGYPPKNAIQDYCKPSDNVVSLNAVAGKKGDAKPEFDDDIPF